MISKHVFQQRVAVIKLTLSSSLSTVLFSKYTLHTHTSLHTYTVHTHNHPHTPTQYTLTPTHWTCPYIPTHTFLQSPIHPCTLHTHTHTHARTISRLKFQRAFSKYYMNRRQIPQKRELRNPLKRRRGRV
jgi:hypothetical protein